MMYVLTGDRQYQKDSLAVGARTTHQNMKERKGKKRGIFYRRPDHSLNEKKKRRAFAQKLEKPLKANNEVPMEVDEIRQEEAETALIEDDDQGSDYDVDEYLDVPSKHSLFHIHNSIDTHHADFSELAKVSGD
jgi:hypothetical protein